MKNLIMILGLFLSLNANATGGFTCDYSDESLTFNLNGVTTRSFENDIVDAGAYLKGEVGDDGFMLDAEQKFVKSDVRQYWNHDDEFRILLYAESEDKSTTVTITTKTEPDGISFKGTLSISQNSTKGSWSIHSPITCGLE